MSESPQARLGLNVPAEWWPSGAILKSFEAAGFEGVQVHAPPASVLADPLQRSAHAGALASALATTALEPVVHAPNGLRIGSREADRTAQGLLSYAARIRATHVVYHACSMPDAPENRTARLSETRSLEAMAARAEQLGVMVAIENLAPVFPGPEPISANPMALRDIAHRIGSDRVGLCLDVGHAHIVAELRHTSIEALIEPVLDVVTLFHLHDNLGARWQPARAGGAFDPLRLDLHLPPGRGSLPWPRVLARLVASEGLAVLEIHPPHRQRAAGIHRSFAELDVVRDHVALAA
jgi:sugar phosphate isomerase/epimerase